MAAKKKPAKKKASTPKKAPAKRTKKAAAPGTSRPSRNEAERARSGL